MSKYYVDCEFDGHNGPLLSIALVRDDEWSIYIQTLQEAEDPWVLDNVVPYMYCHHAHYDFLCPTFTVGAKLRRFIREDSHPVIIADSPVDIGRFCQIISTNPDGGWASTEYPRMTFEVHNVDCYPTTLVDAVQHNAWWDAMALREKLR